MDIKLQIKNDVTNALRGGDAVTLSVLRLLVAAINNLEIDKGNVTLTHDEVIQLIQKQVKQRREAIVLYRQGSRAELAEKEEKEIDILNKYLPQQMTASEVETVVNQVVDSMPADTKQDFGIIMRTVMAQLKGKADGTMVANLVKVRLG